MAASRSPSGTDRPSRPGRTPPDLAQARSRLRPRVLPEGLPDAPTNRRELLQRSLPFIATAALAFGLAMVGPGADLDRRWVTVALVGFVGTALLIVAAPLRRLPDWFPVLPAALFCASVGFLRVAMEDGGVGLGVVLLLAVGWQALYGRPIDLAATIAMTAGVMIVPLVVVGPPQYPESGWRSALVLTAVAAVLGGVVQRLVRTVRQERNLLRGLADVAGAGARDPDLGDRICDAARSLVGADLAVLFAPTDEGLAPVATSGVVLTTDPLPEGRVPPLIQDAVDTATLVEVADARTMPRADAVRSEQLGVRAWAHQPTVARAGETSGVLSVAWREPGRRLSEQERTALLLLASEAASALERADLVARLEAAASHDALTGLPNRRTWDEILGREVARTARSDTPLSVALIDLDRFKAFNDAHGHLAGDQLLQDAARRWSTRLRASDVVARWGGEEFAVLLPDTSTDQAVAIVGRLLEATPGGQTFSAGVAGTTGTSGTTGTTGIAEADDLMAAADAALYRAKAAGRNRIEVAEEVEVRPPGPGRPTAARR